MREAPLQAPPEGPGRGARVAVAAADVGLALAWVGGSAVLAHDEAGQSLEALDFRGVRWVWWRAADVLDLLPVRPTACWDLAAVHRLLHGPGRDDPAAVWAAAHGLPAPEPVRAQADLLDVDEDDPAAVRPDGHLSRAWQRGAWAQDSASLARWATLALRAQAAQQRALEDAPDPRAEPRRPALPLLTAWSESAAAVTAVALEQQGLPVDRRTAALLLEPSIGPRPRDAAHEADLRRERDFAVWQAFPGPDVDLRNPALVRELLLRVGLDLPDTRSWRLEPHAEASPAVAALLAWRKAERLATTYGWRWLDTHVGPDGRLRGQWGAADAAAGRMTASAGLHNLPAELRPAVLAEPGHLFVRADLGQVEPRVLAAVSHDASLARAAREDDLYAPVAAALRCDRPTAKVAVLAAMYGQTSGAAGRALKDMEKAYPQALAYLRRAEQAGREGRAVRTYGGRLIDPGPARPDDAGRAASGRFVRNAMVQGAAAELFKAWVATIRSGLPGLGVPGRSAELVLCLHDEVLLHVPEARAAEAARWVVEALDATTGWWAAGSGVRFVADVQTGGTWSK